MAWSAAWGRGTCTAGRLTALLRLVLLLLPVGSDYFPLRRRSCPLRAERDSLKIGLKASESEKADLVSALEQAKHTVCGMGSWDVGVERHGTLGQHRCPCQIRLHHVLNCPLLCAGHSPGRCCQEAAARGHGHAEVRSALLPAGCRNALAC